MRNLLLSIIILNFVSIEIVHSHDSNLDRMMTKLLLIKTVEYNQKYCLVQSMYDNANIDSAWIIFDFTDKNNLLGARYLCSNSQFMCGYDGSRYFSCLPGKDTLSYIDSPNRQIATKGVFMMNSLYVVHTLLPIILKDSLAQITRIKDTIIDGIDSYRYHILLKDMTIAPEVALMNMKGLKSNFHLCISKETDLPNMFTMLSDGSKWETEFRTMKINTIDPNKIFTSNHIDSIVTGRKRTSVHQSSIMPGNKAPDWVLPSLNNKSVKLSDLRGQIVVLEFWFPGCAGCITSISDFNDIYKTYSKRGVCLYGIEFTNTKASTLKAYVDEMKIQYPTLYSAEQVSKEYGISAAPTIFVIDRHGVIRYISIGSKKDELIKAIEVSIRK